MSVSLNSPGVQTNLWMGIASLRAALTVKPKITREEDGSILIPVIPKKDYSIEQISEALTAVKWGKDKITQFVQHVIDTAKTPSKIAMKEIGALLLQMNKKV